MRCIHCLSLSTVKNGHDKRGVQRYKCKECKKRFCEKGFFARYRHNPKDIINTVELRMHRLSLRETKKEIAKLIYVHVSHVTVFNWCIKFIKILVLWSSLLDTKYQKSYL